MSAVKIIFKRSSLLGKRPTGANLEAGEIGLNTNSVDPGLFFEVNDGSVVKVGPTSYLDVAPTQTPSLGELWVDKDTKSLSIGTTDANSPWQKVAAPFLGGTNGLTVFVAPDYENSTDAINNDGQTVPFVTINRAILEVTKSIIRNRLSGLSEGNNRYLIVLAPGRHCVVNSPAQGSAIPNFSTNPGKVTQTDLAQFNPSEVGGLILPRGVSIIGLDLKKCEIHPTYVPTYTHPSFPSGYQLQPGGPYYVNQPRSSIFKWSGNTYVSNFTGLDKIDSRLVTLVSEQVETGYALFETQASHGLGFNDFVQVDYTDVAQQYSSTTFESGQFYAYPVTSTTFLLSITSWTSERGADPVLFGNIPFPTALNESITPKFTVSNIYPYFTPYKNYGYELHSYSHHRLSILANASLEQLNEYYTKVQKAFPDYFNGTVDTNLVSAPEYDIVAPTSGVYPNNLSSNSTDNSSPYQNMVNHRSDYGMANGDYDGDVVSGFKSVIINSATAVVLQKDPAAFEIYAEKDTQNWLPLTQYTQTTDARFVNFPITSIPVTPQLEILNSVYIPNIRYYYTTLRATDPQTNATKSTGIPDPDNDFRHFGFRVSGSNSYMQAQSTYTIGAAIACWAKRGAIISLTNATTNFGSVAFEAEGFAGIGTLGGANDINKGFQLQGVLRPLSLTADSVTSDRQKRILSLGSKVMHVGVDPNDPKVQLIYLQRDFVPASILPFSLKPGSAVFVNEGVCSYRAFFVTDGTQTCILSGDVTQNSFSEGGAILRVRLSDSTIPNTDSTKVEGQNLEIPYIRRYVDPRTSSEKSYGFLVQSSNINSQAPQLGSVLRLNQSSQELGNTFKRNVQFDPGQYGGISQVFTVDQVETAQYSFSINFNYKLADVSQDTSYVLYTSLTDASTPWVQTVPSNPADLESAPVPVFTPQGSYTTYGFRNFYAAENNLWTSLYYSNSANFTEVSGPTKATPDTLSSPFVKTSVLERNEPVSDSWQGYVPDPYYNYYVNGVPTPYNADLNYMRGAVIPYTELPPQYQVDDDDSSPGLGILFKNIPSPINATRLVAPTTVYQTPQALTSPFAANPSFGRPEIINLNLQSVQQIVQPKEGVSVLELSYPTAGPSDHPEFVGVTEYVRVVGLISDVAQAIRYYYPTKKSTTEQWPSNTLVKVCNFNEVPETSLYDPDWAVTKATMLRFYELMGYSRSKMSSYLQPQTSGQRLLYNVSLPFPPNKGYANLTTAWPVEFNNPSTVIANTHTWQYVGYFDYSRGLPKYQVNQISRKLSYDYLSTSSWGGRLTVMGADETGQLVFLGPIKEAMTGQYYITESPLSYAADKQVYTSPDPVVLPNPVLVYSVDDISGQFDGSKTTFDLKRGGFDLPSAQLSTYGVFVFVGGVVQQPNTAYRLQGSFAGNPTPQIIFSEAPLEGTSCDIRVVTSEDDNESVEVVSYTLGQAFDGTRSTFTVAPASAALNNSNSFVFLGGVEQNPLGPPIQAYDAYSISYTSGNSNLTFNEAPQANTTLDIRGVVAGSRYREAGVETVFVSSIDDISILFDGIRQVFPLLIETKPVDATKVNAQNMFVSLGGVIQIPIPQPGNPQSGSTYKVEIDSSTAILNIIFTTPPVAGTTCNIRVVTSQDVLTCPLEGSLFNTVLLDGPGIQVNDQNQIIGIDPGLIQP